jgi:dipeptidyl aminopeptidase/acylaminoacyl peptidase
MLNKPLLEDNAPWKQRFRVKIVLWSQVARMVPTRGLVVNDDTGNAQLYAWNINNGKLTQLTNRKDGVHFGMISPDGRYIYYLEDENGNEIGHWVRVPFEGEKPEDITPDIPPYSSFMMSMSLCGNLMATTIGDDDGFHTLVFPVEGDFIGKPKRLYHSGKMVFGPAISYDGKIVVLASSDHAAHQHFKLLAFDVNCGRQIAELTDGTDASLIASSFAPRASDYRLLASGNRSGFNRPLIWDPVNGGRNDLMLGGLQGDVSPLDWSPDGNKILLTQSYQAVQRFAIYDLTTKEVKLLMNPGGTFGMRASFVSNDEIFTQWEDSTHPTQLISLDSGTGIKNRTVLTTGDVPAGHPWKSVIFTSSDGQKIQGWLGLPDGEGPFPMILHTHGGPEVVTTDSYIPSSQAWLDHGFAFMAINYRGSIGFGKEFWEKIWGNLGRWEVEDMAAARNWLINEGIADADKILLTGWSYGGYLTLLALGKRPDLWAGGMAGIATVDWAAEYEDLSAILKGYSVAIMGGTPDEKPAQYAASSPITYAQNIKAPVLIIQGRNDTRTPARPVEIYEAKMKALGKDIEVHWFDAGHFGGGVEQDILHQELMLKFAYRVLGL